MPMSQCINVTYQHVFLKKAFQLNANPPLADICLGNIKRTVNKFEHF